MKFNEPIEPVECRKVAPVISRSLTLRPRSSETTRDEDNVSTDKKQPEQYNINSNNNNNNNNNDGGGNRNNDSTSYVQNSGWLLESDERDSYVESGSEVNASHMKNSSDSSASHQYQRIINNALRPSPSGSNAVRFKKQIKGDLNNNNKQKYLIFPSKKSPTKSEDSNQGFSQPQEMRIVNKQQYDEQAQKSSVEEIAMDKFSNYAVKNDYYGDSKDFSMRFPPNSPRPSSKYDNSASNVVHNHSHRTIRFSD